MTEAFNSIFFIVGIIFGIENPTIVTCTAWVNIDFKNQTGFIEYTHLDAKDLKSEVTKNEIELLKKSIRLKGTNKSPKYEGQYAGVVGQNMLYQVHFSFSDKDSLLKVFKFNTDSIGHYYSSNDTLFYRFHKNEKNLGHKISGVYDKSNHIKIWNKDVDKLTIWVGVSKKSLKEFKKVKPLGKLWGENKSKIGRKESLF